MGFDITQRTGVSGDMLVSGHTKLETFLPEIVHYVSTIEGLCCIKPPGPINPKIGFRLVARGGRILDDISFESYNEETVRKVMRQRLTEPTYFNTALLKSFGEKFSKSNAGVKVSLRRLTYTNTSIWSCSGFDTASLSLSKILSPKLLLN